ncbi:VCBS repeat-containing protein [uncultured Imperialibacter sp.]|uniref:FG-GAP repeat domain-containing protein n=1 Tax=uncultured Imperialibacter sp. TaxID=1672639 RepID=UPI0030DAFE7D|tara:strand:- start:9334 stop:11160 length:1827 start_codon:yes stop_codon:yes gene_type:complete
MIKYSTTKLLGLFIFISAITGCSGDDSGQPHGVGEISFSPKFGNKSGSGRLLDLNDAAFILITIKKDDGSSTPYSTSKIELYQLNGEFISQKISLSVGSYSLTEFLVLDVDSNIIYATPEEGSLQAQNVGDPLPIEFVISRDEILDLQVEVVSTEDLELEDFGLVGFDLSLVNLFRFYINVSEKGKLEELLSAELTVESDTFVFHQHIEAIANNSVVIRDGYPAYELTIEREGYATFNYTFTRDSLAHYESSPLTVELVSDKPSDLPSGFFIDSGQALGSSQSQNVALGDLDGDGDLDAFVVNVGQPNKIWVNNGDGSFTDSGQLLGTSNSYAVALGDLDSDGDLDAFEVNSTQPNKIWTNDGSGNFTDSGQELGIEKSLGVALGDLDGDGDLDAFVANDLHPTFSTKSNKVWINDGFGSFTDSGQSLGDSRSNDVSLGDLDGDGDLDAFVVNYQEPDRVWLNDGNGAFTNSGQSLGNAYSFDVSLGDLDMDGDLDAYVVNNSQPDKVWFNNGHGTFTESSQSLGGSTSQNVSLGDLNGDGDLDIFVTNYFNSVVWFNDGNGFFTDTEQSLGGSAIVGGSLGDLDGDGDLDAFVVHANNLPNKVWINH